MFVLAHAGLGVVHKRMIFLEFSYLGKCVVKKGHDHKFAAVKPGLACRSKWER